MSDHHHVLGSQREGGALAPTSHHRGRPGSWAAVAVLLVGLVTCAAGLVLGPPWIVLGLGILVVVAGGVVALAVDVWGDVVLDRPRREPEEPHSTRRHRDDIDELRLRDDATLPEDPAPRTVPLQRRPRPPRRHRPHRRFAARPVRSWSPRR